MNNQTAVHQQLPIANPTLPTGQTNPTTATPPPASPTTNVVPGGQKATVQPPAETPQMHIDVGGGPPTGGTPPPTTGGQPPGSDPANFGQPLYPWLMPYQGQFTAPMSPYEQQGLNQFSDFFGSGQGMGGARDYLNNVLGNNYLDINKNPYLQQIQQGEQGMKNYNDNQAMARLRSSGAAGGSAMSGAELGAESDYMRNSNNAFESLMGQLMNQNYGMERGFQNQAPGQLGGLAQLYGQGANQLMQMGGLPRQLQQGDLNAQYQDWLRQTGGMQGMFQYPDTLTNQLLYGGGFRGQTPNQYGSSQADQLLGLLGQSGIDWGSLAGQLGSGIGNLFSGSGTGGGDTSMVSNYDGRPLGYDSGPAQGPSGYGDTGWYNQALTGANNAFAAKQAAAAKGPNTTPAAILAMLMQLLGGGKKGAGSSAKPGMGGGAGPGGGKPPVQGAPSPGMSGPNEQSGPAMGSGNQYDLGNMTATSPYGYSFPIGPGTDFTENTGFYATDPSLPNIPFANLGESGPSNPFSMFPDQGNNPPGGSPDPFGGGGGFDQIGAGNVGDFGGIDTGGFDPGNIDFSSFDTGSSDF